MNTLTLQPLTSVNRKLSIPEIYHAAVGASSRTLEKPRISIMIVQGDSSITREQWHAALRRAAEVNPGARVHMAGRRQNARWVSAETNYPRLRVVENCTWDGCSQEGMEFIDATPIELSAGPLVELIIAQAKSTFVILRAHHAIMDGMGMLHFLREIFRELRGEVLLGSNAAFSDVDLMRSVTQAPWHHGDKRRPLPLTGGARGDEIGDVWRRLTMPLTTKKNVAGLIAELCARYARSFGDDGGGLVRIAVPVNLRRYRSGLNSTMNFTGLLHIDLNGAEGAEDFREKVRQAISENKDAAYHQNFEKVRYLPLSWIGFLIGRRRSNYRSPYLAETVLITNFGTVDLGELSCENFTAENLFSVPLGGNSFISLYGSGQTTNVLIGMPKVYASEGRMEEFCSEIIKTLS